MVDLYHKTTTFFADTNIQDMGLVSGIYIPDSRLIGNVVGTWYFLD